MSAEPVLTGETPASLTATTTKLYRAPDVSPATVHERLAPPAVQPYPPTVDVTRYDVTGNPPVSAGAAHDTAIERFGTVAEVTATTDLVLVEASTAGPGRRQDVVRLEDQYGRAGTSAP